MTNNQPIDILGNAPRPATMRLLLPYRDTHMCYGIICPKEVLYEAYRRNIGGDINTPRGVMIIVDVQHNDEHICLSVRPNIKS